MSQEYHYTRSGQGIVDAVCKMFERGTFLLGEGDALAPVQEAYLKYREARELVPSEYFHPITLEPVEETDPMDRPVTFEDLYDIFLFAELETDDYSERDLFSRLRGKVEKQARNGSEAKVEE